MKIGEFSKKFNLTTDTVRYYINLGLIFPKKYGKQNIFDLDNENELQNIIELKKVHFSLEKIKEIIYFKKIIKNPTKEDSLRHQNIIKTKINEVNIEIKNLKKVTKLLSSQLEKETSSNSNYSKRGLPIEGLSLLQCPKCSSQLNLSATQIENSEILEGSLSCKCKKQYLIKGGVIFDNDFINWEEEYMKEEFNKNNYLENTPTSHIEFTLKNKNIVDSILTKEFLEGKNILNLKCGGLDLLSSLLENVDKKKIHFFMDTPIDYPFFKNLKDEYDKMNLDKKIIFFIGDFSELPLKKRKFNILVDIFATSNYSKFIYSLVDDFLQKESNLISLFAVSERLLHRSPTDDFNKIKNQIINLGFRILFEHLSEFNFDGGKYSNSFSKKNKTRLLTVQAKKK